MTLRMEPFRLASLVILLTCTVCFVCAEIDNSSYANATHTLSRRKRTLIFHPISRGFFRVNIKDAVADNSSIWAQGIGFRMNIEFYNPPGLKITRRDVHQSVESMIMSHGFDGRACILRTFCEVSKVMTPKSGILFKLFKLIFRSYAPGSDDSSIGSSNSLPEGDDKYFPYLTANDCNELDRHCPITQLDMDHVEPVSSDVASDESRSGYS
uniref:Secreted protein n=1 Tax=Anopheles farauti TaxID=69004 RepID=A0A182QSA4_9DIPT